MATKSPSALTVRMGEGRGRVVRQVQASAVTGTLSERFAQIRRRAVAIERSRGKPGLSVQPSHQSQRQPLSVEQPRGGSRSGIQVQAARNPPQQTGRRSFLDVRPVSGKQQAKEDSYRRDGQGRSTNHRTGDSPRARGGAAPQRKSPGQKADGRRGVTSARSNGKIVILGQEKGKQKPKNSVKVAGGAGQKAGSAAGKAKAQHEAAPGGGSLDPASLDYQMDQWRHQAGRGPDPDQAKLDREMDGYRQSRKGDAVAVEGST